ncbi:MAG TPA: DUF4097 family beta strand repeat-containing protein [Actinomycetota bacterium]
MDPMTYETPDGVSVELRIPAGDIHVKATDTTQAVVRITGERNPDDIEVECSPRGSQGKLIRIGTRRKSFGFGSWGRDLRVDLTVPVGTDLDTETGSADLNVDGEIGSVSVRTGSGDVSFEDSLGNVTVKAASGDVNGGAVAGSLTVHGASGDLRARSVGGPLVCRTASGDLQVGRLDGDATVTAASGDIRIDSADAGTLSLKTVSGDIAVGVKPGTAVWLDLTSTTGDAVSDLDGGSEPSDGATLEVHATAVSGDIRVHRAVE